MCAVMQTTPLPAFRLGACLALGLFLGLFAGLAVGCESVAGPDAEALSFSEMQALNPGISAAWILREYPYARETVRDPRTGQVRRLAYWVEDPAGDNHPVLLNFDARGILERKDYGGPMIRPPAPE